MYDLYEKYLAFMNPSGKVHLFLDEVQEIEGWQKDLRKLYDGVRGLKIVVTGSNSSLLKGEYATLLTGRTIPHEVYPFSFREIVKHRGILTDFSLPAIISRKAQIRHAFSEYLLYGGFPEVVNEENTKLKIRSFEGILQWHSDEGRHQEICHTADETIRKSRALSDEQRDGLIQRQEPFRAP